MKNLKIALVCLCIIASVIILVAVRLHRVKTSAAIAKPDHRVAAGSVVERASVKSKQLAQEPLHLAAADSDKDAFHVLDENGNINAAFIKRYGLSVEDVEVLEKAKLAALQRIVELDRKYVIVDSGKDATQFKGHIPSYREEGAVVFDEFYGVVEKVLGGRLYKDYKDNEVMFPVLSAGFYIYYAGLLEKEFSIERTTGENGRIINTVSVASSINMSPESGRTPITYAKLKISGNVNLRSELNKFDGFLEGIAPSWLP